MGKMKSLLFGAIFCLSFWSLGFSQTVILKSGQKVEGKITEQTDEYVKVEFEGVELIFYSDEISSIEQTSPDGSTTLTPQMEMLYKAYTASLNAQPPLKKEEVPELINPVIPDLSGPPLKNPELVKSIVAARLQLERNKAETR